MTITELVHKHFKGNFITPPAVMQQKLQQIKAVVFDWDGVFNNGEKSGDNGSVFSEVDAMGTNMLRFNHYLRNKQVPVTAIITGENNMPAFLLAKREHFNAVYYKALNKKVALQHLNSHFNIQPHEILFVFDDVLDFSVAQVAGLRIMVGRSCNPLLIQFAVDNNLVDYITQNEGGKGAVREAAELILALSGLSTETFTHRMQYSNIYQQYITDRNEAGAAYFQINDNDITQQRPI
ncbi:MAG TPA: hypothetical protein VK559_12840 [Ferruginibacter sp.]|nr:hypothetical protein [Ferruginibacter sp.]